jgi:hypothetical protein
MLAHTTPASGVVLTPVTNFALQDRAAGTVTVNSSVAMWRKLERMGRDPHVALAFHTRAHALHRRPEYVLVQGRASITPSFGRAEWRQTMGTSFERFGAEPFEARRLWHRWLRVYHRRVNVVIAVERLLVWPDLECRGAPDIRGVPLPADAPAPQRPPGRGTAPRIDHGRAARSLARLPDVLLGWVGTDGFPVVAPVEVAGTEPQGILLDVPAGIIPPGGRRAGVTGHRFTAQVIGQRQHRHTGWVEAGERVMYSPHTNAWYWLPPSRFAFNLAAGYGTRRGLRQGRQAGIPIDVGPG